MKIAILFLMMKGTSWILNQYYLTLGLFSQLLFLHASHLINIHDTAGWLAVGVPVLVRPARHSGKQHFSEAKMPLSSQFPIGLEWTLRALQRKFLHQEASRRCGADQHPSAKLLTATSYVELWKWNDLVKICSSRAVSVLLSLSWADVSSWCQKRDIWQSGCWHLLSV